MHESMSRLSTAGQVNLSTVKAPRPSKPGINVWRMQRWRLLLHEHNCERSPCLINRLNGECMSEKHRHQLGTHITLKWPGLVARHQKCKRSFGYKARKGYRSCWMSHLVFQIENHVPFSFKDLLKNQKQRRPNDNTKKRIGTDQRGCKFVGFWWTFCFSPCSVLISEALKDRKLLPFHLPFLLILSGECLL